MLWRAWTSVVVANGHSGGCDRGQVTGVTVSSSARLVSAYFLLTFFSLLSSTQSFRAVLIEPELKLSSCEIHVGLKSILNSCFALKHARTTCTPNLDGFAEYAV